MVRGGHGTARVVVVGGPALLDGLGDEQRHEVDEEHEPEGEGHVAAQQEQKRAPHGDGVVVPEVGRHEDVGPLAEPQHNLEEKANADEHHAKVGGVAHRRNGLPADVERRLGEPGDLDHAGDERGEDVTEGGGDEGHAHEADADEHGGLEGALARGLEDAADNVDDDGNGDVVAKGVENRL